MIDGIARFEIQDGFHIWIQVNTDSMGKSLNFPEITEKNTIIIIRGFFTNFVAFFYQWETDMTTTGKNMIRG